jgi:type II secretory pathway component PulK
MNPAKSRDPRSGSALLIVLGVMAVLSVLVMEFGRSLRTDLKAAGGFADEVQNEQLARSALAVAQLELAAGAAMYANATGEVYFVTGDDTAEEEIEALSLYRQGLPLGRGVLSYRFLMKPNALDINELGAAALGRLFEVACEMDESDERSALADAILDWIDTDSTVHAFGAEEEVYQALDPPRHCRKGVIETIE